MAKPVVQLTEEQRVAQAEERRLKKLQAQERIRAEEEARSRILPRTWIDLRANQTSNTEGQDVRRCKIMTWNVRRCIHNTCVEPTHNWRENLAFSPMFSP